MVKLSIIIPAFNAEATIRRAITSVINCNDHCFELIVVDDGSNDSTSIIVSDFIRKDQRVRLIQQPNYGRSVARNKGLSASSCNKVMFLDADDQLLPGSMEYVIKSTNNDYPIIIFPYVLNYKQKSFINNNRTFSMDKPFTSFTLPANVLREWMIFDHVDQPCHGYDLMAYETNSVWSRVYDKRIFKTVYSSCNSGPFPSGIRLSEDRLFNIEVLSLLKDKSVLFESRPIYIWEFNNSKTVGLPSNRDAIEMIDFCRVTQHLLNNGVISNEEVKAICSREFVSRFLRGVSQSTENIHSLIVAWNNAKSVCKPWLSADLLVPPFSGLRWDITRQLLKTDNLYLVAIFERFIKHIRVIGMN